MIPTIYRRAAQLATISLSLSVMLIACDDDEVDTSTAQVAQAAQAVAEQAAAPTAEAGETLPTTTAPMALNQGESQIPATITVPTGCTTFNDSPTTIRIDHGEHGESFGVQVQEGNEFNTNHAEFAGDLRRNQYGNVNEILVEDETLLLWKAGREDSDFESHNFRLIVVLAGKQWVCSQGNNGGWTREQADRQIEACRTLAAL